MLSRGKGSKDWKRGFADGKILLMMANVPKMGDTEQHGKKKDREGDVGRTRRRSVRRRRSTSEKKNLADKNAARQPELPIEKIIYI